MSALGLVLLGLVAARPVQAPFRGELESLDWKGHSTGVLALFADGTRAEQGRAAVDACSPKNTPVRAGFSRTRAGPIAVVHVAEPATAARVLALGACLSKQPQVKRANAYFFPLPDSGVEVEAAWKYEQGVQTHREVYAFRDDPEYARWVRRRMTRAEWVAHQWKAHPLSELARDYGLFGREVLERTNALLWETGPVPTDVGEDLAHLAVYLPTGVALEVRQRAEKEKVSTSKLIADALGAAQKASKLGEEEPGVVPAPDGAVKERQLELYLPRTLLAAAEAVADSRGESVSVVVRKAWARAYAQGK